MIFTSELQKKVTPYAIHNTVTLYRCNVSIDESLLNAEIMAQSLEGNIMVYIRDLDGKADFIIIYQADTAIEPTRAVVEATFNPKRYQLTFHTYGRVLSRAKRMEIHTDPLPENEKNRYLEPIIEGKLRWPHITKPLTEVEATVLNLPGYRNYDASVTAKTGLTEEQVLEAAEAEINKQIERETKRTPCNGIESQFALNVKLLDGVAYGLPEWQPPFETVRGAEQALADLAAATEAKPKKKPTRRGPRTGKGKGLI